METVDYVIVGGGAAGCVLANRLSADADNDVLVLEAGRPDRRWDFLVQMPAGCGFAFGNPRYDWLYRSEPEEHLQGRQLDQPRGKLIGGSSSINGMIFLRGNQLEYDQWAAEPGMETWSYAHCLPYFKRSESFQAADGDPAFRGRSGPLQVQRSPIKHPLAKALFDAAQQVGHPLVDDINGYRQEGFGAIDNNAPDGRRFTSSRGYLRPVRRRRNLRVRTRALVTRIIFEGDRAVGVEYVQRRFGREVVREVRAREVILAGGAINTPQLLQLAGIGDAEHLRGLGIEVRRDLPGVGENLQDHQGVTIQHICKKPISLAPYMSMRRAPEVLLKWLLFRSGPGSTAPFDNCGFLRSNDDVAFPNLQITILPVAIDHETQKPIQADGGHSYQLYVGPTNSDARGSLRITSTDPKVHPSLRFNYFSTDQDRREFVEAIRVGRELLSQQAFAEFDGGEVEPGPAVQSDEELVEWVARTSQSGYHPCGTCKLGTGADAVVDPLTMKVHGFDGLRVVDASVMPAMTNANLYASVVMIAEKSADLILGKQPPAPVQVDYHRHDRSSAR